MPDAAAREFTKWDTGTRRHAPRRPPTRCSDVHLFAKVSPMSTTYFLSDDIEAAAIVASHLAAWAQRAKDGVYDSKWQPMEPAPRGATQVATRIAQSLMAHEPFEIETADTSPSGLRAIARGFAVAAYDLRDHPSAQNVAANLHHVCAATSRRIDQRTHREQGDISWAAGPEITLQLPNEISDIDLNHASEAFATALYFANEITWRRMNEASPGTPRETYTLVLQGIRRAAISSDSWAAEVVRAGDGHADPATQVATLMDASHNTSFATLAHASELLVSTWVLILDFLIGAAERLGSGPACDGYLRAAALALTETVSTADIAASLES